MTTRGGDWASRRAQNLENRSCQVDRCPAASSRRLLSQFVQRFGSVARLVRAVSGALKQRRDGVAKGTVVVNDQYMPDGSRGRRGLSMPGLRDSPKGPTSTWDWNRSSVGLTAGWSEEETCLSRHRREKCAGLANRPLSHRGGAAHAGRRVRVAWLGVRARFRAPDTARTRRADGPRNAWTLRNSSPVDLDVLDIVYLA